MIARRMLPLMGGRCMNDEEREIESMHSTANGIFGFCAGFVVAPPAIHYLPGSCYLLLAGLFVFGLYLFGFGRRLP